MIRFQSGSQSGKNVAKEVFVDEVPMLCLL